VRWLGPALFACLAFATSLALARAGGGQHYSPPGGGYGGSSPSGGYGSGYYGGGGGGGGGLGYLIYLIIRLTFTYPLVMIPLWLFVGYLFYRASQNRASVATPREIRNLDEQRMTPRRDVNDSLAELQRSDPSFDADAFFERTKKVFLEIQEAWFRRNLDPVRQYMSDGLHRRFTTLLALMQLQNQRNGLADAQVLSARLLDVTRTAAFDCLTVRIHASLRDVDVPATDSDEQARKKARAASAEEFTELWTFVRRRDAKTKPGWDASQGKCPNCDWVLSEITQPSEYLPHDDTAPGLDGLQAHDPDAAPELLQDRGLLLFWKWLEAWAFADVRRLQKLATKEAITEIQAEIDAMAQRKQSFLVHDPAVGGTRVAAVETGGEQDRVHVEIRWSAMLGGARSPRPYRSILTMVRSASAKTDRGVGLSTERCGSCGAPLSDSDSTKCDFCGHELSEATLEWQFETLVPYEQWQRPMVMPRRTNSAFATSSERLRLMRVMVAIVKADGVVEPQELRLLRDCALRWHVPWPTVQQMLDERVDETFADLTPQSPEQARAFVEQLVEAAQVDGRVDRRERQLIYRAAARLGLDNAAVDGMLG
jgi:predicted lipid-binding transport protein (Tim44 family)